MCQVREVLLPGPGSDLRPQTARKVCTRPGNIPQTSGDNWPKWPPSTNHLHPNWYKMKKDCDLGTLELPLRIPGFCGNERKVQIVSQVEVSGDPQFSRNMD